MKKLGILLLAMLIFGSTSVALADGPKGRIAVAPDISQEVA
jgi:hypothetical protein